MAKTDINKLLNKKGWTGAELGKLEIATVMKTYQRALDGEKDPQPAISSEDFTKLLNTLEDPAEGRVYNGYLSIHDWISRASVLALSQEQQAQLRYNELATPIETAQSAEQLYQYIAELPVIMTEKQYKETVEKRTKEILNPEDPLAFNIFNLLQEALDFYVELLQKDPRKKNPLKPLKKSLERELVTDPHILTRYNEVMGHGYYTLPDGRRSDEMSEEDWQKAIAPAVADNEEDQQGSLWDRAMDRKIQIARDVYSGMSYEEASKALQERDEKSGLFQKTEWHLYEDPPADLNKWEILEAGDLWNYYPSLNGEEPEGMSYEEAILEDSKAFREEFPTVVEALLKDMDKTIAKGISSIPVEGWIDYEVSWDTLYKLDAYGFRAMYVGDTAVFDGNQRAIMNGIAILRPSDLLNKSKRIDSNGYYSTPKIERILAGLSLLSYAPDNESYATLTAGIEEARNTLTDSVYWITGFNTAVNMVADFYDVPELKIACVPTDKLLKKIQAFNDFVAMLYGQIMSTDYEDEETKTKKLDVLRDVFYPIDTTVFQIPEEKIKKARGWLKQFKAFKDEDKNLCNYLCYKGVNA